MSSTALTKITIPEEAKIKELYEKISLRCSRLQQLGQGATDYDKAFKGRLSEAILFLQNACQGSRVTNAVEQLQLLAQKLGLKYQQQGSSLLLASAAEGTFCFVAALNELRSVTSVKLILGKDLEQPDCHVMLELLRDGRYRELGEHLESLVDLSNRLAACQQKHSALTGLLIVESILLSVHKSGNYQSLVDEILQSHLGHVIPRTGGLPIKLIIFARPHELLDKQELSVMDPIPKDFGFKLTILAESSPNVNILPATTAIFNSGKFHTINSQNGVVAQAMLVMQLLESLPTCTATIKKIHQFIYGSDQNFTAPQAKDYLELLIGDSKGISRNEARVVHLPGQRHYYLFPDSSSPTYTAEMLSKISFIHPVVIVQVVPLLRQQLVFNSLVKNCYGITSSHLTPETSDTELVCSIIEITPPSTIRFEASLMGTGPIAMVINVDQTKPVTPEVHMGPSFQSLSMNHHLSQILSKCLSIPVMLYSYIKRSSQPQTAVTTTSTGGWQNISI